MLLAVQPEAFVLLTIRPFVSTESMLLVHLVRTLISAAVGPYVGTLSIKLIFGPLSIVAPIVRPHVGASAIYLASFPFSFISCVVSPLVSTFSMLTASLKYSCEWTAVWHAFSASAVLHVFKPLSIVHLSILVHVLAYTIGFVILKLAHKYVSVSVIEAPSSFSFPDVPLTNVFSTIWPVLSSESMLV